MKEKRGDTSKKTVIKSNPDSIKEEIKIAHREKSSSMPNPVKGLTLSLYSMIKEH
ncbi:MAG: hypothetical protein WBC05_16915 [Sedimentisphaerales bacterium]